MRTAASSAGPGSGRRPAPSLRRRPLAAGRSPHRASAVPRTGTGTGTYDPPCPVWTLKRRSAPRRGLGPGVSPGRVGARRVGARAGGFRIRHGDRERVLLRVRPRVLVRRPWPGHRLPRDLEVVHQLRPGPDGRALAGLRRVLDKLVQARIALAVPAGLDPHDA